MTLERACGEFLLDLRVRKLAASTIRDYESIFRKLRRFADERGKTGLAQVDQELLRDWRATWTYVASTHQLRITKLKAFFRFAVDASWISKSPADRLRAPQERSQPTMPLSRFEMRLLLEAARSYAKERALLMLMRYSGLAIRDATTLERSAITGNLLTLRRAKSNELVLCSLPDAVIAELNAIADPRNAYFFWTGKSSPETVSRYWRARLTRIAELAGVKGFATERGLQAATGETGIHTQAGRGKVQVGHSHAAGPIRPASGRAGVAAGLGWDILRTQLRVSPGRSAHQAVAAAQRQMAAGRRWVVDLDLEKFFDNIEHSLMLKALRHHTRERWTLLYVERWLQADEEMPDGRREARGKGTPEDGVARLPVIQCMANLLGTHRKRGSGKPLPLFRERLQNSRWLRRTM